MNIIFSHREDIPCWRIYTKNPKFANFGFFSDGEVFVLKLQFGKKYDFCAFACSTYCNYQGGKYYVSNIVNGVVILFPDLETKKKIGFHIYNDNAFEVPYDKFIEVVSEIWEERTPIEGFNFEVDPIFYIKEQGI